MSAYELPRALFERPGRRGRAPIFNFLGTSLCAIRNSELTSLLRSQLSFVKITLRICRKRVLGHVRNAPQTLQLDSGRRSRQSKGEKQQGEYRGKEIGLVGNEEMEGRREKRSRKEEQSERKEGKGRGWSRKEKKEGKRFPCTPLL